MNRKIFIAIVLALSIPAILLYTGDVRILSEINYADKVNSNKPAAQSDLKVHGLSLDKQQQANTNQQFASEFIALKQEIAVLKAEISSLHSIMKGGVLAKTQKEDSLHNVALPENTQEIRAKEKEREQKEADTIELSFKQQTKDQDWSNKITGQIQQAFASAKVASDNILAIDCRVTMCRIELIADDQFYNNKAFEQLSISIV